MTAAFDMTNWRERLDHLQTEVIPRQRRQVRALCERLEQALLEQYPDEAASVVLEPDCSRLHFNDQGLTVETYGQVRKFTIPTREGPPRVATRRLKPRDSDYSVVALLDASHEVQVQAMLKFPDLTHVILARHGRGNFVETWRLGRASTDGERLPREGEHQRQEGTKEHEPTGVLDDRVGR